MHAAFRYPITSKDLTDVVAVTGILKELPEESFTSEGSVAPSYYKRKYQLEHPSVIYSKEAGLEIMESIVFYGYSTLSPINRIADSLTHVLDFDNHLFFDAPSDNQIEVLLLIGGPDIQNDAGNIKESAKIEDGDFQGKTARAFFLSGNNKSLDENFPLLVGLQEEGFKPEDVNNSKASHPLVFVDALRIAVRNSNYQAAENLGKYLTHPSQPQNVKLTTLNLLNEVILALPNELEYPEKFLRLLITGWEMERSYPLDKRYLEIFTNILPKLTNSDQHKRLKGIAEDYSIEELLDARNKLAKNLRKK